MDVLVEDGIAKDIWPDGHPELHPDVVAMIRVNYQGPVERGWIWNGTSFEDPIKPPTGEELLQMYTDAIQEHLDTEAQTRKYDGILSLCTYVTSPSPKYSAEGQAGVEWRDAVWSYASNAFAEVALGTRPQPTIEELIAELPVMVWPA